MVRSASQPLPGYETTFITRPEMTEDSLRALKDRLTGLIQSFSGEIVLTEDWGKRRLAYPIEKETRGQYSYLVYTGKPGVVSEIERTLRIQDHVLRYLSVTFGKEFDGEEFKKQRAAQLGKRDEAASESAAGNAEHSADI